MRVCARACSTVILTGPTGRKAYWHFHFGSKRAVMAEAREISADFGLSVAVADAPADAAEGAEAAAVADPHAAPAVAEPPARVTRPDDAAFGVKEAELLAKEATWVPRSGAAATARGRGGGVRVVWGVSWVGRCGCVSRAGVARGAHARACGRAAAVGCARRVRRAPA